MPRWLFPTSAFRPIALSAPAIANLGFAVFFGNGSYNPKDNANLAPGGAPFVNGGGGPILSINYATMKMGTNYLTTAMGDNFDACTLVYAVQPPSDGDFVTYFQFVSSGTDGTIRSNYDTSRSPHVSIFTGAGGGPNSGGGSSNVDGPDVTHASDWNLFAYVSKVGKPVTSYNLTKGTSNTGGTILSGGRTPGHWNIGASTGTFVDDSRIAFAMGATSEVSATDLNALAAALRYPLGERGIIV